MKVMPRAVLLASALLLAGCHLLIPSRHAPEAYRPAFAAATAGHIEEVAAALDKRPSLIREREWGGSTLLHDAAQADEVSMARFLITKGAAVNARADDERTALHMAAQNGSIAMIDMLIAARAKLNPIDAKGWTPLDRAERWHHPEAAQKLLSLGARRAIQKAS